MTDIDTAIAYYEEIANNFEKYKRIHCITEYQFKKGSQSGQLAEWLKELKKYREWLESFNSDSATECFTAVRELRSFVGRDINIPTKTREESEDKE